MTESAFTNQVKAGWILRWRITARELLAERPKQSPDATVSELDSGLHGPWLALSDIRISPKSNSYRWLAHGSQFAFAFGQDAQRVAGPKSLRKEVHPSFSSVGPRPVLARLRRFGPSAGFGSRSIIRPPFIVAARHRIVVGQDVVFESDRSICVERAQSLRRIFR